MEKNQASTNLRKRHATKDSLQNTFIINGEAKTSLKEEMYLVVRGKP
jgi:hypothetical protein